ncbi:MAG: 3-oxoacyl-[acyl-carrier protein] reductase, partial [Rheinheimera aquimaris]
MNKLVIVTGASRGLGLAICRQLLQQGYTVLALARTLSSDLNALTEQYDSGLTFVSVDLSDLDNIQPLCSELIKQHGRPYALINNAAVGY